MIKGIIFDMDGLLIDSEPLWMQAELEIFHKIGVAITEKDCKKMQGVKISDVVNHWYKTYQWNNYSPEEITKQISQRVEELIIEKGRMQPGVIETLKFFKERNIPMAIASSSAPELIKIVVEKLGIKTYFQFLHSSIYERRGKPAPDVFLSTAKKLNVKPEECLVFEDSVNGVKAAKTANMIVVAVPYPDNYDNPDFAIADIKLHSLEEWNEGIFNSLIFQT